MFIEEYENYFVYGGIAILIAFMAFIIWDLAKKSNAGKWGTFILFFVLGFGMLGFVLKGVIAKLLMP